MSTKEFSQDEFNRFIVERDIVGFFEQPVTLKSGRVSHWYINWRAAVEDAATLDDLADYLLSFVDKLCEQQKLPVFPETFIGVPEGATKLGIVAQMKWARRSPEFGRGSHVVAMGRGKPKAHGIPQDRFFVGLPKGPTIIVEDTTTTGGSLLETLDKLLESQVHVVAAIGLSNRMEYRDDGLSVAEAVAKRHTKSGPIPYFHMSEATELLPLAALKNRPPSEVLKAVEGEFASHGVKSIEGLL